MNSVEVLGFSVTTTASDEEKEAAYKFIEWWNSENTEGSSPALEWSVSNWFPSLYIFRSGKRGIQTKVKSLV